MDAGTRERLLIQYTEKLEQFRLLLEKGPQIELKAVASRSIYSKDRKLDGTPVLSGQWRDPVAGRSYFVMIKSDNIIVTRDKDSGGFIMTLVDPY